MPVGVTEVGWFLQYVIFQTSCRTLSELIQTYYFWARGLTSRRAFHGLIYYCPDNTPQPHPPGKAK